MADINKAKIKIVRDHVEFECDDVLYRVKIKSEGCQTGIDITKIQYGDGPGSILIEPHVSNNVSIW